MATHVSVWVEWASRYSINCFKSRAGRSSSDVLASSLRVTRRLVLRTYSISDSFYALARSVT